MQLRKNIQKVSGKRKIKFGHFAFWLNFAAVLAVIYELGFTQAGDKSEWLHIIYAAIMCLGIVSLIFRYLNPPARPKYTVWPFDFVLAIFLLGLIMVSFGWNNFFSRFLLQFNTLVLMQIAVFILFFRELSTMSFDLGKQHLNPARLFVSSFLIMILMGTLLLMLPNATFAGISFLDALFMSTSAICVTGLEVVSTATYFTTFGQIIILILIQLGGIGILTFTSYFSYFFKGSSSYENQLLLRDMTNSEKIADVFSMLTKIILTTFLLETVGALVIYTSLSQDIIPKYADRVYFSIFHSISSFCNSGFSTLTHNMYDPVFRFNYPLHLYLAVLFMIGGLGFPIVFNSLRFIRNRIINIFRHIFRKEHKYLVWSVNISTRIIVVTTVCLITLGTILYFALEYNHSLAEHKGIGKIITAFFGAVSPRSAGFFTVETARLAPPTLVLIAFLMWIGASPGSTGGGIKTSTFAIAVLNFWNLARGKDRIEVLRKEISGIAVKRAFAIIMLSILGIGISVFLLSIAESDKNFMAVAFESFSAYCTAGMSMGITSELSSAGKLIIAVTMFAGRMSLLTVLAAFLHKLNYSSYRYPAEDILIN